MATSLWSDVSSVQFTVGCCTMFSSTKTCNKEFTFLLLFGWSLTLFTMSGGSLVDSGCSPQLKRVSVTISGTDIECGKKCPLSSVGNPKQPEFSFPSADEGSMYVLTMIDPDAPSNAKPKFRSWLHFMAVNVGGKDLKDGNIPENTIVMEYNPPGPPKGSGFHRYITLALKQSKELEGISFAERKSFNIDDFVQDNALTPKGSNMFETERK